MRASTTMQSAVCPSITNILVPLSVPSAPAVSVTPASSQRPFSSVKATVAIVAPEAMAGRYLALASSEPAWISVLAASTTVEKNGAHSSARPISSSTTVSST